ncbi:hypothetical protein EDF71_11490 [Comamonas sp. JUb58]|nr:hypothetical protein EDF71_11490 [Comamonas sp. JUb58]
MIDPGLLAADRSRVGRPLSFVKEKARIHDQNIAG